MSRRGTTLGTVLLTLSVGLVMTLTVGSVSLAGSQFARSLDNRDTALNLAEAVIAEGLASVQERESYGILGSASRDIEIESERVPGSSGFLTFNRQSAAHNGISYSSNHFSSNRAESGSNGRIVPRSSVHLVGVGQAGNSRVQMEAIIFKPPFSEGVCCAGKVYANNLFLGGIRDQDGFTGSYATTPDTLKMAAHVFANGLTKDSVVLVNGSDVRGNVGARGGIQIRDSQVRGEVSPRTHERYVPELDIEAVVGTMTQVAGSWPWMGPGASPVRGGGQGSASQPMSGYRVISGGLDYHGDLHLNGGALYVKGDVHIKGAVIGQGAIIATGKATIDKGAAFSKDYNLTLCANGPVTLHGTNKADKYFQGMVYSETEIRADNISVIGAVVTPGRAKNSYWQKASGDIFLDNVSIYPCPRQVSVTMGVAEHPQRLRERPPVYGTGPDGSSFLISEGKFDALSVRVDVSQLRDGQRLHNGYVYYAKDLSWGSRGQEGWTGNAAYFRRNDPSYRPINGETNPIALLGLTDDELLYQLNETVANITDSGSGATYLVDPRTLTPAHNRKAGDDLAPAGIMASVRQRMQRVGQGEGKILDFNLSRRLPPQERYRVLLMREF